MLSDTEQGGSNPSAAPIGPAWIETGDSPYSSGLSILVALPESFF
jgi:hypothetical protein